MANEIIISSKAEEQALGIKQKMVAPFKIMNVVLKGVIAEEEGVADGTKMVLFIVTDPKGFTSKKGNHYEQGTAWYSKPLETSKN